MSQEPCARVGRSRSTMRCIGRSLSSTMARRQVLPTSWTHGHCFSTIHMLRSHIVQVSLWTAHTDVFRTYPVSTSVETPHFLSSDLKVLRHHLYLRSFVAATSVLCINVPELSCYCPVSSPPAPLAPVRSHSTHRYYCNSLLAWNLC